MNAPAKFEAATVAKPIGHPREATPAELAELLRPFIGAKAFPKRDPASLYGGYLPETAAVDILHISNSLNADVRAVTDEGVEIFFYKGCELVRWPDVRRVTIRALDGDGTTESQTVYEHHTADIAELSRGQRAFRGAGL